MGNLLKTEDLLYKSAISSQNDRSFLASFYDYFEFVTNTGVFLLTKLNNPLKERKSKELEPETLLVQLMKDIESTYKKLKKRIEDSKFSGDGQLGESLQSIENTLNGSSLVIGGNILDELYMDFLDLLNRMMAIGLKKEADKFIKWSSHKTPRIENIVGFETKDLFVYKQNSFDQIDSRTVEGCFTRLLSLYSEIKRIELANISNNEIDVNNILGSVHKRNLSVEYLSLMSGGIENSSGYFKKERFLSDLTRLHNFIVINNSHTSNSDVTKEKVLKNKILTVSGDQIYHHEIGKLSYDLRGDKTPKYIKTFINVISYMPEGKSKIRVDEFEKNLPEMEKVGHIYRRHIGKGSKSFQNFLKKNGIKNVNPKNKEIMINATDEYIFFNNDI